MGQKKGKGGGKPDPAPLRAFMELVCAGLAQNPYISAAEKKAHVEWFEGYFKKGDKVAHIQAAVEEERRIAEAEAKARGEAK